MIKYGEDISDLDYSILVHCHLPWEGVWQRPQQFLSRLSEKHPVLFIESAVKPGPGTTSSFDIQSEPRFPNVYLLKIQVPEKKIHDRAYVERERRKMVKKAQQKLSPLFDQPVQWFYDPMAVKTFANQVSEIATVYDCMDQLSQFKFAPPELASLELQLLELADVVFAGGPKLYKAKRMHNDNCHCYGCGVEVDHFAKAMLPATEVKEDLAALSKPVLGYVGVVDERLDYQLLAKLADANPKWNVVIIGPTCKVDPSKFPQRKNLHWLGRREYKDLPHYLKGFDVCMMPFAINEHTEYINPTKAQEYMAAGKPIVSTPVEDVVLQFSNIVKIGQNHEDFIDHCRAAIDQPDTKAIKRGLVRAENMTWDSIVGKIDQNIRDMLVQKYPRANSDTVTIEGVTETEENLAEVAAE